MKKNAILIIAACFLLKGIFIVNGTEISFDTSSPVIQSAVSQVASIIDAPFAIMAGLMKDIPLFPEYRKPAKEKGEKKGNEARGSKCLFFINPAKELKTKFGAQNTGNDMVAISQLTGREFEASVKFLLSHCRQAVPLLVFIFLILLPRSDIPWSMNKISQYIPSCVLNAIGFFYLRPADPAKAGHQAIDYTDKSTAFKNNFGVNYES